MNRPINLTEHINLVETYVVIHIQVDAILELDSKIKPLSCTTGEKELSSMVSLALLEASSKFSFKKHYICYLSSNLALKMSHALMRRSNQRPIWFGFKTF